MNVLHSSCWHQKACTKVNVRLEVLQPDLIAPLFVELAVMQVFSWDNERRIWIDGGREEVGSWMTMVGVQVLGHYCLVLYYSENQGWPTKMISSVLFMAVRTLCLKNGLIKMLARAYSVIDSMADHSCTTLGLLCSVICLLYTTLKCVSTCIFV